MFVIEEILSNLQDILNDSGKFRDAPLTDQHPVIDLGIWECRENSCWPTGELTAMLLCKLSIFVHLLPAGVSCLANKVSNLSFQNHTHCFIACCKTIILWCRCWLTKCQFVCIYHYFCLFVCVVQRLFYSCKHSQGGIFACTAVFTPASRAVMLCLWGDLTCILRICLYRRKAIEKKEGGVRECQF